MPEIVVHKAGPKSGLWQLAEADAAFGNPYWAYHWGGGLALARYVLDQPEAVVGKLSLGDRLPVRVSALEAELPGVVSEISPAADPGSRTFLVKLDLPQRPGLRAGQFGRVAMPVGDATALRVPASAVRVRGQMETVFLVSDGKARLRIVRTGKRIGDEVELVSGIEPGETVVVDTDADLLDGQPLRLR